MATSGDANNEKKYDVFLNHRGPDSKITIASILYWWLRYIGLQVFLDFEELEGGRNLQTQIKEAIASASVHVAIFSPQYAKSVWCLKELHLMTVSGKPIIPIFYQVEPQDLRGAKEHRGAYAAALDEHENKKEWNGQPRHNSTTVLNWRNALSSAAEVSGFDLRTFNGNLGVLLFKVVQCVFQTVEKLRLQIIYEKRYRSGGILDTVKTIGMHDQVRAVGRMLLNYIGWVPRPWSGIKEFNGGIEEFTDLSHDMKMIVLKTSECMKCRIKMLNLITKVEGVESMAVNVKKMTLTVIGSPDPVNLTFKLRKFNHVELLSVGPAP